MKRLLAVVISFVLGALPLYVPLTAQAQTSDLSRVAGRFVADNYTRWQERVFAGPVAAASPATLVVTSVPVSLPDGRSIVPFWVGQHVTVGTGSNSETVQITAVNGCYLGSQNGTCSISGNTSNSHGQGDLIVSETFGLEEAIFDANSSGGGVVTVDRAWAVHGGTNAMLTAAVPFSSVNVEDTRYASESFWTPSPNATILATPATLTAQAGCDSTHTFCSDATVAGSASWGGTVYGCITYVDIMGQESPTCSATASFTSVASKAIDIGAPVASAGAVGWKPYLSVSGGSYALAYSVPLLTQAGVSTGVCTLTTLETITPACAVANTTYGQASSGQAQFTGYPVVTSQLAPEVGSASATTYNPNSDGHTVYTYTIGSHVGVPGTVSLSQPFPITAAAQTTVGEVLGTVNVAPGFMNYVGRAVEICGLASKTSTTADTVDSFKLLWDAEGSNVTAGTPVTIGTLVGTPATALAAAANFHFCFQVMTTVASTTATGSSIFATDGYYTVAQTSAGANPSAGVISNTATVGSLNTSLNGRFSILMAHTTGTDGAGVLLQNLSVRVLN